MEFQKIVNYGQTSHLHSQLGNDFQAQAHFRREPNKQADIKQSYFLWLCKAYILNLLCIKSTNLKCRPPPKFQFSHHPKI